MVAGAAGARAQQDTTSAAVPVQQTESTTAAVQAAAYPVIVGRDTVLVVRVRLGSFTAAERAAAVSARLHRLSRSATDVDSLRLATDGATTDLIAGDQVIMTVTEADAAAAGMTQAELAASHLRAIQIALDRESLAARLRALATGAVLSLLTLIITIAIFRFIRRVFGRATQAIEEGRGKWVRGLRIQHQQLVSADDLAQGLLWTVRVLRIAVLAFLLYVTVPIILSFFPVTRPYADRLFAYIAAPFGEIWAAFSGYVPNIFTIAAIAVFTYFLLKLIRLFFEGLGRGNVSIPGFYAEWARPTYQLVRTLVLVFAFIMMWPYLPGSDSPAFRGVGVMLGLLLSLGSASAISNVIGGVVLTYMRPFNVGHRVKIADTIGDVIERTLLVTRVRTIKNVDVTIPNAMVLSNHIVNYSSVAAEHGLVLHTTVTIGYDAPWRQVHELLIGAAADTDGVLSNPPPFVYQTSLNDFYVSYELNAYVSEPNRMAAIYSDLHSHIQDRFNDAGVEIMSPHYRAQRDGNAAAIPAQYLIPSSSSEHT